jgi:DNA invertase Pin-like site-specific DNA recombinase
MSLKVGYGRTSTLDQQAGLDAQIRDLTAAGAEKIFTEQVSAVGKRPQLEAVLDFIREGDTLVITKLARLARSTHHLLDIADPVKAKGADLCIINLEHPTPFPQWVPWPGGRKRSAMKCKGSENLHPPCCTPSPLAAR